jgi:flagellin FlaB
VNGWVYAGVINSDGAGGIPAATADADNLLESGEKYRIDLTLADFGVASAPGVYEQIKIEVKPPEGAVLVLQKTMPPAIVEGNSYSVY